MRITILRKELTRLFTKGYGIFNQINNDSSIKVNTPH